VGEDNTAQKGLSLSDIVTPQAKQILEKMDPDLLLTVPWDYAEEMLQMEVQWQEAVAFYKWAVLGRFATPLSDEDKKIFCRLVGQRHIFLTTNKKSGYKVALQEMQEIINNSLFRRV
jgi:hypothetical protein